MFNIQSIAKNLSLDEEGIWITEKASSVSYPHNGNQKCLEIEEKSFWFQHRNKVIQSILRLFPPTGEIIDVGAGNGYVAHALCKQGYNVCALEPGIGGARAAKERGIGCVIAAAFDDVQFLDESISAIGMFDVLEHIADDITTLRTLHQKLTPHSRLYITVPTYSFLWSHEDDYAGHFRRYTVSRLMRTLHQAGFITEYSTYFFAPLILPILFLRAIPHYLGFVKEHRSENDARDHILTPNSSSSRIINAFLDYELDIISKGRSIFAGTSCMVVAKKDI